MKPLGGQKEGLLPALDVELLPRAALRGYLVLAALAHSGFAEWHSLLLAEPRVTQCGTSLGPL